MSTEEDLYGIGNLTDEDIREIGKTIQKGEKILSVKPETVLSIVHYILQRSPELQEPMSAAKAEIEAYTEKGGGKIALYREAWIFTKHLGSQIIGITTEIINRYKELVGTDDTYFPQMKLKEGGSFTLYGEEVEKNAPYITVSPREGEPEEKGSFTLYGKDIEENAPYIIASPREGEYDILIPIAGRYSKNPGDGKSGKDSLHAATAVAAGLSLLLLVSEPRRTAQVVYMTNPNMVVIFIIIAVVFLLSSYLFFRKPIMKLIGTHLKRI